MVFLIKALKGSGVGGLLWWFCCNVHASFNVLWNSLAFASLYLAYLIFCKLELLGKIEPVCWMDDQFYICSLSATMHSWNVSSSCTVGRAISFRFHWRFACGHASCTASRILVKLWTRSIRVFRSCWEPVIHAPLHHPWMVEYKNSWQIIVGPVIHAPLAHLLVPTCKAFVSLFLPLFLPFLDSYTRQF